MGFQFRLGQRRWLAVLITAPAVAGFVVAVKLTGLFQLLEWATYDWFFRLRPVEAVDDRLLIVAVDESDIDRVGQWPLPDKTLAQVIRTLNQHQPTAIGLDLYRNLPVEPGHQTWIEVMESTENLIGVEKAIGRQVPPPPTLEAEKQVALTDLVVDADGKIRRALLSYKPPEGVTEYGLGTQLALMYLEDQRVTVEVIDQTKKHYHMGQAVIIPFQGNDGGYVRTDSGGYQILLNYRGQQDRFVTVSLSDVLDGRLDPKVVRDRIVLIGSTAPSLNDEFLTPYSNRLVESPQATPGVVIHANIVSQMISAALDGRSLIRVWPEPFEWLWILAWSSVGATLHWGVLEIDQYRKKVSSRWKVLGLYSIFTGGILVAISYKAFLAGWWLPVISPLVALIGSAIAITGSQVLQLQHQRLELAQQNLKIEQQKIRAEAASQAKSQFLAKMSHELRTPLNVILGFTQMMHRSSQMSAEHRDYLRLINRSGEHLLELINDILDLSKVEAGMMFLNPCSFDLYALLDGLEEMFQVKAANKNLLLNVQVAAAVPHYINTDRKKLRICLINLLSNGIKFTQTGSVTLRVDVVPEKEVQQLNQQATTGDCVPFSTRIVFEVEDTGPGIAPEEIEYLFQDFFQTQTGQQSAQGTGLGLAITRSFVELMGGTIQVSSTLNKGTSFTFDIKVAPGTPSEVTHQPWQRVIGLEPNQQTYRILVVDDTQENRLLWVKLLEPIGFEVREAGNGQEAITVWECWQPHLIWMDTRMPVMDGLTATREIRLREQCREATNGSLIPSGRTVIIALTASSDRDQHEKILAVGYDDLVSKLASEEVVFAKLSQHLGVRYRYNERLQSESASFEAEDSSQTLIPNLQQDLTEVSLSWVTELHQAASALDEESALQLIEQLPSEQSRLAEGLKDLINNFRLDLVFELTQSVMDNTPNPK